MKIRTSCLYVAAILAAVLVHPSSGFAQDRSNGEMIANTLCSRCHTIIGTSRQDETFAPIPSFSEVADKRSTTAASLQAFLSGPHAWMPNYPLTKAEIADLSDYILSLKK